MSKNELCIKFIKLGSVMFLLPIFMFTLPDTFALTIEHTPSNVGHVMTTGNFTGFIILHKWDVQHVIMLLAYFLVSPMIGIWIKSKKLGEMLFGYGLLVLWVAAFAIGIGKSPSFLWVAPLVSTQNMFLYVLVMLIYAVLLLFSIHFHVVRNCLTVLLSICIIWGCLAAMIGLYDFTGQIINSLGWLVLMLWPGLLLMRNWYVPKNRLISVIVLILYISVTVLFVVTAFINPQMSVVDKLSISCLSLGCVCLIIDTVFVFLSHRKAAIPAAPGDPPAPAEA